MSNRKNDRDRQAEIVREVQTQLNIKYYPGAHAEEIAAAVKQTNENAVSKDVGALFEKYKNVLTYEELTKLIYKSVTKYSGTAGK